MESLISCIVPVFNGERYLSDALESILKQTYRPIEIIVVDDGSTDASADVVDCYRGALRYVRQSNKGPAAARNLGLSIARGEFVAFLDQDDLWHSEKLARQIAWFGICPALSSCVSHVQKFFVPEMAEIAARCIDYRPNNALAGYLTGTLLARRSAFDIVGLFDAALHYGDAMDWFARAAEQGLAIKLIPDVLMYHRVHQNNFSRRNGSASRNEFLHILKGSLDRRRLNNKGAATFYKFS
jgi:glycosyltransferase involved in cell wall biosynthesis